MFRKVILSLVCSLCMWSGLAHAQNTKDPNCGAPNLTLVVDTSGSMLQANKIAALKIAIQEAVTLFKKQVRTSLIRFSNGQAEELVPMGPSDVKDSEAHAQKMIAATNGMKAIGDTPMTAAIRLALLKYRDSILPPDPLHKDPDPKTKRRSFVLLMTDGEPTDGAPKPIITLLRNLKVGTKTYDIKTFVVGLGSNDTIRPFQLDQFAKVGGTEKFYQATNPDDLKRIFQAIARGVSKQSEICDGRDNDCDGKTDEDITRPCQTACGKGVEICRKGNWTKCNAPQIQREVCDGFDNDCDGQVDEGELTRDCSTACGSGTQPCLFGDWATCTAPRPEPEVCDGQDNDCNGAVDDGVTACPGGKCVASGGVVRCEIPCRGGECPAGFICNTKTNKCDELPCRRKRCPAGQICVNRNGGQCVDLCQGKACPAGTTCGREGTCINCYEKPCAPGMYCRDGLCNVDKCYGVKCGADQGCRDGVCFDTCATVKCPEGQVCQTVSKKIPRGTCVPDKCYGTTCGPNESCVNGQCIPNKCSGGNAKACSQSQICEPSTGLCYDNPCLRTECPKDTYCKNGECLPGTGGSNSGGANSGGVNGNGTSCVENADCGGDGLVCRNGFCVNKPRVQGNGVGQGCGCALAGQSPMTPLFWFACLFGALFLLRRRVRS